MNASELKISESCAFTLVLQPDREWDLEDLADSLYEAGFQDEVIGLENGRWTISMEREGQGILEAAVRAIKDVEKSGLGLKVVSFNLDEAAVTMQDWESSEESIDDLRTALSLRERRLQVNRVMRRLQHS